MLSGSEKTKLIGVKVKAMLPACIVFTLMRGGVVSGSTVRGTMSEATSSLHA
jgi:hypothetical protein